MPDKRQTKNRAGWDIIWRGGWVAYNQQTKEQFNLLKDEWSKAVRELEQRKGITWY